MWPQARPDGFRNLVAPQLRGEGNWAGVALYGSAEHRTQVAAEALLSTLPFWHQARYDRNRLRCPHCRCMVEPCNADVNSICFRLGAS